MSKTIFIIWRPWIGPFVLSYAPLLKARGYTLHLYGHRSNDVAALQARCPPGIFDRIAHYQILYDLACAPAGSEAVEIERARKHEAWLGCTFARLAVGDRHLGRGYALGGFKFPTSPQSRASYAQQLAAYSGQIEFWRREIEAHRPCLVIDVEGVLDHVARREGIPVAIAAASRHKNLYYWANNSFFETPELERAYSDLKRTGHPVPAQDVEQAMPIVTYWQTAMQTARLSYVVKSAAMHTARRVWHRAKGTDLGPTYDLTSDLAMFWRQRRQTLRMIGKETRRLDSLRGTPFVFFPLATEPEATLQGLSPEYFFQLEAIAAIARDLPAGVKLAVKEHHPACGLRSDIFYDQILLFKNVVLLDMRERGPDVIAQAAATITIAGSAGFEAAAMGKPTIVLGRRNPYDFLPHVCRVEDIAKLKTAIDDALEGRLAGPSARSDGSRMLQAMDAISFDLGAFDPFAAQSGVEQSQSLKALSLLARGLGWPDHDDNRAADISCRAK